MELDLLGEKEIASFLKVQPGTVHQWRKRGLLPSPAAVVSGVPVWQRSAIEAWAIGSDRLPHSPQVAATISTILSDAAAGILQRLSRSSLGRRFYLAGGTALALHLNHRVSRDLDFFPTTPSFTLNTMRILDELARLFRPQDYSLRVREAGQLNLDIQGTKVAFIAYPFALEDRLVKHPLGSLASVGDIAAMKAYSIGRRAVSRDYIDLYYILARGLISMDELVVKAERIFILDGKPVFDALLFAKQLTYTDDLEDVSSVMDDVVDKDLSWTKVQEFLKEASAQWLARHIVHNIEDGVEL